LGTLEPQPLGIGVWLTPLKLATPPRASTSNFVSPGQTILA